MKKNIEVLPRILCIITFLFFSNCSSPPPPQTPQQGSESNLKEILTGTWKNDTVGISVTFDIKGTFEWKQGNTVLSGNYSISNDLLYLSLLTGKTTPYKILSISNEQLVLKDPRGVVAYLFKEINQIKENTTTQTAEPKGGEGGHDAAVSNGLQGQVLSSPFANIFRGEWLGPYGLKLELKSDGTFVWSQPDYKIEGKYSIVEDNLIMDVQGNPTKYKIISAAEDKIILRDPENHEIDLAKKKTMIQISPVVEPAVTKNELGKLPPKEIIYEIKDNIIDENGIFSIKVPEKWKVSRKKDCSFPCDEPIILSDSAGRQIEVILKTFITRAGPGAFETLVPYLDKIMGDYSKNREKIVDEIDSMNGYEVFSRRFTGKTQDESRFMVSRIIGVHFMDYLVLGVVVTSTSSKTIKSLKMVMTEIIEKMNFKFDEDEEILKGIIGTWIGSETKPESILSMKSKHLFFFYEGGRFIHSLVSDKFLPTEESLKAQISNPACDTGSFRIAGKTIILDFSIPYGPPRTEGHPLKIEGKFLYLDSILLEKVVLKQEINF